VIHQLEPSSFHSIFVAGGTGVSYDHLGAFIIADVDFNALAEVSLILGPGSQILDCRVHISRWHSRHCCSDRRHEQLLLSKSVTPEHCGVSCGTNERPAIGYLGNHTNCRELSGATTSIP